jgi:hypothetical protein
MIYKTLILLTCHESKDCLQDTILNYIKFNKDVCIVVNNGIHNDNLDELKSEHVHIVNRKVKKEWLWSLIPYHIELWDYIVENNIQAEYVITLSSNQSFVKHGLYELMKKYIFNVHYDKIKRFYSLERSEVPLAQLHRVYL